MARYPLSLPERLRQEADFLRGSGLRVQTIVVAAQDWDWPVEQIAAEYGLGETQVREALAFYQAHPMEIGASLAAEAELEGKCE